MTDENTPPSFDETPLSPIERQESLEKHLQMRPDAQDLKNRNILRDTNAAPYTQPHPHPVNELGMFGFGKLTSRQSDTIDAARTGAPTSHGQFEEGVGEASGEGGTD